MSISYRPAAFSFWPYVFRTITRARVRSALTVFGVFVAMLLFGFVRSMEEGMDRLEANVSKQNVLIIFERNTF